MHMSMHDIREIMQHIKSIPWHMKNIRLYTDMNISAPGHMLVSCPCPGLYISMATSNSRNELLDH